MSDIQTPFWFELVPSELKDTVSHFDEDLTRLVALAAYIGDTSGDQTPVSYSSLMIALLWNNDPDSTWFQGYVKRSDVATDSIYHHRGIKDTDKETILSQMENNDALYAVGKDFISASARAMLQNAAAIASEVNTKEISVRHLLAAYAFRNPTYHEKELISWNIEVDTFRLEFAKQINQHYRDEIKNWNSILHGYIEPFTEETSEELYPGSMLSTYPLEEDTIKLLRMAETLAEEQSSLTLDTKVVLVALLSGNGSILKDAASFQTVLGNESNAYDNLINRLGIDGDSKPYKPDLFSDNPSKLNLDAEIKRTLDRARTFTYTTTPDQELGVRHIIAALIVNSDTFASKLLIEAGADLSRLRRGMLHEIARNRITDDGVEWNKILIGLTPPTLTPYKSDNPEEGNDCLDVSRYASAFATVMAAHSNKPPMSIGIFGDWGSGKSFFMRLMREKTKAITQQPDMDGNNHRVFCENVLAIEFNAWHYAETNLWASLVHTILSKLNEDINEDIEAAQKLESLELAKSAREETERLKTEARTKEMTAKIHYDAVKKRHLEMNQRHQSLLSTGDVIAALSNEILSDKDINEILSVAKDRLGLEVPVASKRTIGELEELLKTAQTNYSQMKSTWEWLKQPHIYSALLKSFFLVTLIIVIVSWIYLSGKEGTDWVNTIITDMTVITGVVLLRAKSIMNGISQAMSRLGSLRSRIDVIEQGKLQQREQELDAAELELRQISEELSRASERVELEKAEVLRIQNEINGRSSINQIAGMIERRLAGKDYEQYLSIVSMIRRDFESLSDYFSSDNQNQNDSKLKRIDRIVLYIDDLDRCPSDQVVKVLEAVHLMLAFKLFVVVVGVDMRWASISLHEHYPAHLSSVDTGNNDDRGKSRADTVQQTASAMDYLEKIFQIPFWLPPMEEKASRDMLAALVPVSGRSNISPGTSTAVPIQVRDDKFDTTRLKNGSYTKITVTPGNTNSEDLPSAESLEIVEDERRYMLSLAGAVGRSPRRLKRFVNTYRILKASCDPLEREGFVMENGKKGSYRAVMTLLAITTGAPSAALKILLNLNEPELPSELNKFSEDVKKMSGEFNSNEVNYALKALETYAESGATTVKELKEWVSRASHFSFRSGRI